MKTLGNSDKYWRWHVFGVFPIYKIKIERHACYSNITWFFSFELLIYRGANPAAVDRNGKTPLQTAVEIGALTDEELFLMLSWSGERQVMQIMFKSFLYVYISQLYSEPWTKLQRHFDLVSNDGDSNGSISLQLVFHAIVWFKLFFEIFGDKGNGWWG